MSDTARAFDQDVCVIKDLITDNAVRYDPRSFADPFKLWRSVTGACIKA